MTDSPLSNYYKSVELSPVEHNIKDQEPFNLHLSKRQNLLEFYLKLPFLSFRNAEVLEFGPGSGENATCLAKHGARLTIVEPVDYLIEKLRTNFSQLNLQKNLVEVHNNTLENFNSLKKFDHVIAEGFVHFLDDQDSAIKKLFSFVGENGFFMSSVSHPAGTFIEFIKKVYLLWMIEATGAKTPKDRLACAKTLFYTDFEKTNHSRSFESWVGDTVLNPLFRFRTFLDYEDFLEVIPKDFYLYASWPNILNSDDLVWHKTIKDPERKKKDSMDSYYARYPHFIHGIPRTQEKIKLFNPAEGKAIAELLKTCLKSMDQGIDLGFKNIDEILRSLEGLRKQFSKFAEGEDGERVLVECILLFKTVKESNNTEDFEKAYMNSQLLRKTWGCPGHYYVFQRNG